MFHVDFERVNLPKRGSSGDLFTVTFHDEPLLRTETSGTTGKRMNIVVAKVEKRLIVVVQKEHEVDESLSAFPA